MAGSSSTSKTHHGRRNSPRKARPCKPLDEFFRVVQEPSAHSQGPENEITLDEDIYAANEYCQTASGSSARQSKKRRERPSSKWNCPACTYLNSPQCLKCQMCFTQWVPPSIWSPEITQTVDTGSDTQKQEHGSSGTTVHEEQHAQDVQQTANKVHGSQSPAEPHTTSSSTDDVNKRNEPEREEDGTGQVSHIQSEVENDNICKQQSLGNRSFVSSSGSTAWHTSSSWEADQSECERECAESKGHKGQSDSNMCSLGKANVCELQRNSKISSANSGIETASTPSKLGSAIADIRSRTSENNSADCSQRSVTPTQPYSFTPSTGEGVRPPVDSSAALSASQRSITPTQTYKRTPHSEVKGTNDHAAVQNSGVSTEKTSRSITPTQPYRETPGNSSGNASTSSKCKAARQENELSNPDADVSGAAMARNNSSSNSSGPQCHSTSSVVTRQGRDLSDLIEAQKSLGFDLLGDSSTDDDESDTSVEPTTQQDLPSTKPHASTSSATVSSVSGRTETSADCSNAVVSNSVSDMADAEPTRRSCGYSDATTSSSLALTCNFATAAYHSPLDDSPRVRTTPPTNQKVTHSADETTAESDVDQTAAVYSGGEDLEAYADLIDRKAQELLPHFSSIEYLDELQSNGFITLAIEYGSQFNSQKQSKHFSPQEIREAMRKLTEDTDTDSISDGLRNVAQQQLHTMKQQREGSRSKSTSRRETKQNSRGKGGQGRGRGKQRSQGGAKRGRGGKKAGKASVSAMPVPKNAGVDNTRSKFPRSHATKPDVHTTDDCYADDATGIQLCGYEDPLLADVPSSMWEMSGRTVYGYD